MSSSTPPGKGGPPQGLTLLAMCIVPILWMAASSCLILLNKILMRDKGFHYPMALSGIGQAVSGFAAFLVCRVFRLVKADRPISQGFFFRQILPIGLFMAGTLLFGNAVYMHLSVSFIQMLKACTPMITMLGIYLAGLETPSQQLVLAVLVIALGTMVASYGEINLSLLGVLYMLLSEVLEAVRLVATQFLLQGLEFHPMEAVMYLAPACVLWLVIGSAIMEAPAMVQENAGAIVRDNSVLFVLAGCMGFAVNTLAFFSIKLCGSLTLKVLGTVKNTVLVVVCVVFLNEVVTALQSLGYAVAITGFGWYQWIKTGVALVPVKQRPETASMSSPLKHSSESKEMRAETRASV